MSDLKLFRTSGSTVNEVKGTSLALEKSLQTLIEQNLETLLGVRFLASEFTTDQNHGGRMDTLGLDENGCPVIIEYKRSSNMNVINQGLFYLDWLVTHRGDFEMVVLKKFGEKAARSVEWSSPRLICIAGGFSRFDEHAIKQMSRNIELIRYVNFNDNLLLLEQMNAVSAPNTTAEPNIANSKAKTTTASQALDKSDERLKALFQALHDHLSSLGDDVQLKALVYYFAFKRMKNFACVEVKIQDPRLIVYVKVDPDSIECEKGFTRDVRMIGHFGTGDLEITIRSQGDIEKASTILQKSYDNS